MKRKSSPMRIDARRGSSDSSGGARPAGVATSAAASRHGAGPRRRRGVIRPPPRAAAGSAARRHRDARQRDCGDQRRRQPAQVPRPAVLIDDDGADVVLGRRDRVDAQQRLPAHPCCAPAGNWVGAKSANSVNKLTERLTRLESASELTTIPKPSARPRAACRRAPGRRSPRPRRRRRAPGTTRTETVTTSAPATARAPRAACPRQARRDRRA